MWVDLPWNMNSTRGNNQSSLHDESGYQETINEFSQNQIVFSSCNSMNCKTKSGFWKRPVDVSKKYDEWLNLQGIAHYEHD